MPTCSFPKSKEKKNKKNDYQMQEYMNEMDKWVPQNIELKHVFGYICLE